MKKILLILLFTEILSFSNKKIDLLDKETINNSVKKSSELTGKLGGKGVTYYVPYENGIEKFSVEYINGKREGKVEFHDDKGRLLLKGQYVNGKKDGIWEVYDKEILTNKVSYKNDIQDGVEEIYYENGIIYSISNYVKGKLQGEIEYYTPTRLIIKGVLDKSGENGDFEFYSANGEVKYKGKLKEIAPKFIEEYLEIMGNNIDIIPDMLKKYIKVNN